MVVARVEAYIAGWAGEEALKRSHAYVDAGADAILMHSKLDNPSEIKEFMDGWNNRAPVIIVPTKYYKTPTDEIRSWDTSMVIWANHNMRAAVQAMQEVRLGEFCCVAGVRCLALTRRCGLADDQHHLPRAVAGVGGGQRRASEGGLPPAGRGRAARRREEVPALSSTS